MYIQIPPALVRRILRLFATKEKSTTQSRLLVMRIVRLLTDVVENQTFRRTSRAGFRGDSWNICFVVDSVLRFGDDWIAGDGPPWEANSNRRDADADNRRLHDVEKDESRLAPNPCKICMSAIRV